MKEWTEKGIPTGLRGEQIPLEARMIAVADSYDAMTSNRRYRSSLGQDRAVGELIAGKGSQFDATLVEVFRGFCRTSKGYKRIWPI